jgi:hypothetical protein
MNKKIYIAGSIILLIGVLSFTNYFSESNLNKKNQTASVFSSFVDYVWGLFSNDCTPQEIPEGSTVDINDIDNTITIDIPYTNNGSKCFAPIFETVYSGAVVTPASGEAVDFTNPVTYTVNQDGYIKEYVVTVNVDTPVFNITSCDELQKIGYYPNESYTLASNIDCSDTVNWNDGKGFEPIGNDSKPFAGSFDGKGYTISNLYINRPTEANVGLFGYVSGNISNTNLIDINVVARDRVGGISGFLSNTGSILQSSTRGYVSGETNTGGVIGENWGSVERSFSSAYVSYQNSQYNSGGLVGNNFGFVVDSYASGDVAGSYNVGGLVGTNNNNEGNIYNCYSVGRVYGYGSSNTAGGFIGYNAGKTISNSYWNKDVFGYVSDYNNFGAIAKTTTEMKTPSTFSDWDINIWDIVNGDYPTLKFVILDHNNDGDNSTCQQLQNMNNNLSGNYKLENDVYCNGINFTPIGNCGEDGYPGTDDNSFKGTFDGNGYTIYNLNINLPNTGCVGLFGSSEGQISNVKLVNTSVYGWYQTGALVGYNKGVVDSSYSGGVVKSGGYEVGGLVGQNEGTINNSYSYVNIPITGGNEGVRGGLVGANRGGTINNSYSTGIIFSENSYMVGGFVGGNFGTINSSYFDLDTSNKNIACGLSYSDGEGCTLSSGGSLGKTRSEMKTVSTFSDWDTSIWNLVDGAYPTLKTETVPPTNSCPFNNVLNAYNECESCDQNTDYLMTSCGDKPTLNPCNTCSSPERHLSVGAGCWYCVRTCGSLDGTAGMVLNTSTNECVCPPGTVFDGYGTCIDTPVVNVSVSLEASPTTVWEGKTTNISWTPTNAKTCTAFDGYSTWPGSLNATDGEHIWTTGALPANNTNKANYIYGVTCSNDTNTITSTTTVTVLPDLYPSGIAGNPQGRMSNALNTAGVTLGSNEMAYLLYRDSYYDYTNQSQIAHTVSCPVGSGYRVCVEDYNDGTYNHVLIGVK